MRRVLLHRDQETTTMMMIRLTPKTTKILKIVSAIAVILGLIWYLFSVRIITASIYFMLGLHAPFSVKLDCAKETEQLVTEKFKLPLAFDQASKDGLRQFWHYSYYTGCLQNHGYDHYGNPLPVSTLENGKFINRFGKFTMDIGTGEILSDNQVDVAYDDRLIVSDLRVGGVDIFLGFYKKYDPKTIQDMQSEWTHFPYSEQTFSKVALQDEILTASDSSGLSGCLGLYNAVPVLMYGTQLDPEICTAALKTIKPVLY